MKHRNKNSQRGGQRKYHNRSRDRDAGDNFPKNNNNENNRSYGRSNIQSILPSAEILQEYEYACEGTVDRLLQIVETEQDRRNAWEDEYLSFHKKTLRIGQLFGFVLLMSVIWGTIYLAKIGKDDIAMVLAVSGFLSVAAASLFNEIGRRLSRRPKKDRR